VLNLHYFIFFTKFNITALKFWTMLTLGKTYTIQSQAVYKGAHVTNFKLHNPLINMSAANNTTAVSYISCLLLTRFTKSDTGCTFKKARLRQWDQIFKFTSHNHLIISANKHFYYNVQILNTAYDKQYYKIFKWTVPKWMSSSLCEQAIKSDILSRSTTVYLKLISYWTKC